MVTPDWAESSTSMPGVDEPLDLGMLLQGCASLAQGSGEREICALPVLISWDYATVLHQNYLSFHFQEYV